MSFPMVHLAGVHARVGRVEEGCDKKSHPLYFVKEFSAGCQPGYPFG